VKQIPSADAPSATTHVSQGPLHSELQHTPPTQKPLAQNAPKEHSVPFAAPHVPIEPHTLGDAQLSGSGVSAGTAVHRPGLAALLQLSQLPQAPLPPKGDMDVLSQQTPSTQKPVSHWFASEQGPPRV
jgi:hypothetical protein